MKKYVQEADMIRSVELAKDSVPSRNAELDRRTFRVNGGACAECGEQNCEFVVLPDGILICLECAEWKLEESNQYKKEVL
jgi:excinuclease UvrABC ATPase subunit